MKHEHAFELENMLRDQKISDDYENRQKRSRRNLNYDDCMDVDMSKIVEAARGQRPVITQPKIVRFLSYLTYDLPIPALMALFVCAAFVVMWVIT